MGALWLTLPSARAWWLAHSSCLRTTSFLELSICSPTSLLCWWGIPSAETPHEAIPWVQSATHKESVELPALSCQDGVRMHLWHPRLLWRIYRRSINLKPENVEATRVLHNLNHWDQARPGANCVREEECQGFGSNNATWETMTVREMYTSYFFSEGAEP